MKLFYNILTQYMYINIIFYKYLDGRNIGDNSKMLTESKEISKDDINSESLINISNHGKCIAKF